MFSGDFPKEVRGIFSELHRNLSVKAHEFFFSHAVSGQFLEFFFQSCVPTCLVPWSGQVYAYIHTHPLMRVARSQHANSLIHWSSYCLDCSSILFASSSTHFGQTHPSASSNRLIWPQTQTDLVVVGQAALILLVLPRQRVRIRNRHRSLPLYFGRITVPAAAWVLMQPIPQPKNGTTRTRTENQQIMSLLL